MTFLQISEKSFINLDTVREVRAWDDGKLHLIFTDSRGTVYNGEEAAAILKFIEVQSTDLRSIMRRPQRRAVEGDQ